MPNLVYSHQALSIRKMNYKNRESRNVKKNLIMRSTRFKQTDYKRQVKVRCTTVAPLPWIPHKAKVLFQNRKHQSRKIVRGDIFRNKS